MPRWQVILFFGVLVPVFLPQLQGCKKGKKGKGGDDDDGGKKKKGKKGKDDDEGGGGGGSDVHVVEFIFALDKKEGDGAADETWNEIKGDEGDDGVLTAKMLNEKSKDATTGLRKEFPISAAKALIEAFEEKGAEGLTKEKWIAVWDATVLWKEFINEKAPDAKDAKKAFEEIFGDTKNVKGEDIEGQFEKAAKDEKGKDMVTIADLEGGGGDGNGSMEEDEFAPIFDAVKKLGKGSLLEDFRKIWSTYTKDSSTFVSLSNASLANATNQEKDDGWDDRDFKWTRGIHGKASAGNVLGEAKAHPK